MENRNPILSQPRRNRPHIGTRESLGAISNAIQRLHQNSRLEISRNNPNANRQTNQQRMNLDFEKMAAEAAQSKADKNISGKSVSELYGEIKQADITNLMRKVKSGKTLTAAERKLIDGLNVSPSDLVPQKKICEIFRITRKSIAQWRREGKEGVPEKENGQENLTKWREFFASNPDAGFFDGKPRTDRESLLCRKLEIEIECKKIELKKLEDTCIDMVDVQNAFYKLGSVIRAGLLRMQADLPPGLEGQSPSRMAKIIGESSEKLLTELSETESELWLVD